VARFRCGHPSVDGWPLIARDARTILIVAAFVAMVDRSVMPPLVPVVAADLDSSIGAVGHSLTVYALAYAAFQLVWSTLSTRWGRIRVLTISTAMSGLANVGSALATDTVTYSVARGLSGAAFAATITGVLIYFGDTLTMKQRAVAMANLAAAISLGLAAGTVAAGVIAQWWSWRWVYVGVALACAVLVGVLAGLKEPPVGRSERLLVAIRLLAINPWAMTILFFAVIEGVLLIGVFNYLPVALQAEGASVLAAGLVTAAFGVTVVVATQLMKLVLGHWPAWLLLLFAGLAMTTAYVALAVDVSLHSVLAGSSLLGLAWALGHTTIQTWMTDAVADVRATGMSFFSLALFAGASVGAALGGVAAAGGGFAALFVASVGVSLFLAATTSVARAGYRVRGEPAGG
jgi:predicted MFS family arabinose efflux permease